jgi:anaerobic magnesium-protoporphyrin IX monomethyl ester cyclase
MSTKILFTHSYFLRFDSKQWKLQQPYPPLATIYAAAFVRNGGFSVSLFDTMFASAPEEILPAIEIHNPKYVVVYDDGFNYLTKMCLTNMREAAFRMIQIAKARGCKVIVSSSDATDHAAKYIQHGADFVIKGEGEITLLELLKALDNESLRFENITGLLYTLNGKIYSTGKREVLQNLDTLPIAGWDLINMDEYKRRWKKRKSYFSLNVSTTRGCPFHCNWCAKPIYGNRYNVHSPQRVINEIKFLIQNFGVHHFWMTDDIFGLKPGWIKEFADIIVKESLKFKFKIQSRVDLLLQENNIEALAKAGCETIWVGAESGSQKILDAMDKGTQLHQIYAATKLMKKHGIKPAFFLQFGYLDETYDDIKATINMVMDLMPDDIGVSVSYPLPGTKFYEKVFPEMHEKQNWTDSDDLSLMFKNTYPSPFYKTLQRYLHEKYRTKQGLFEMKQLFNKPFHITPYQLKRAASLSYHAPAQLIHRSRLKRLQEKNR